MANSKTVFKDITNRIHLPESKDEIESIVYRLMENQFGLSRSLILMEKQIEVNWQTVELLIDRINRHEPIQYILNEEYFFGRKFYVDSSALIPRPETEELIQYVLSFGSQNDNSKIIDIGTGSGCIALTLAREIKSAEVKATDISDHALSVAKRNNQLLSANVDFIKHDILKEQLPYNELDWIVSNPPYISIAEKKKMSTNVLSFEPHLALFADPDPLVFYKAIGSQAKNKLKPNGKVLVEINETLGPDTAAIFQQDFSEVKILKDINGKDRFVFAQKSIS